MRHPVTKLRESIRLVASISITLVDDPMPNPLLLEEPGCVCALQQRERRQQPRFGATACGHGYRTRRTGNRPARVRIQDMAIADAVVHEETVCIAAGRERTMFEGQNHRRVALATGSLDADLPGAARRCS